MRFPYQPIQLAVKLHLTGGQLLILRYVVREKGSKLENLDKAIHVCELCDELKDRRNFYTAMNNLRVIRTWQEVNKFCDMNHLHSLAPLINMIVLGQYRGCIDEIKRVFYGY